MKGQSSFVIASTFSPVTEARTNRQAPTGGVISEMLSARMIMIPAWTGSMPILTVSGASTGARMIRVALMSITSPMSSSSARIRAMITIGSEETDSIAAAIDCGIWLKVIHQPRMVAEAMIRKITPVIRVVRTQTS